MNNNMVNVKVETQRYAQKALVILHTPGIRDSLVNMLNPKDPVNTVAAVVVLVAQRIDTAARQSGMEVPDVAKACAAMGIVKEVAHMGAVAKRIPQLSNDQINLALSVTVQNYIKVEVAAGRINAQQMQMALKTLAQKLPPKTSAPVKKGIEQVQQTGKQYSAQIQG